MIRIGAQLSQALGFEQVIREAGDAGLCSLQLFSRSPVGGQSRALPGHGALRPVLQQSGIEVLYIHAPYFVNPAALQADKLERARYALKQEMRRAKRLSAHYVVLHPGHWQNDATRAESEEAFAGTVAAMLAAPGRVLIENTAGQGRELGASFDELAGIFHRLGKSRRVGLMLDTAHAMAAGYQLSSRDDVDKLLAVIDRSIGLNRISGIHLNDTLYPVGSHRDRHTHLLKGQMGELALKRILAWAETSNCPLILETPGRDVLEREEDIRTIRELL